MQRAVRTRWPSCLADVWLPRVRRASGTPPCDRVDTTCARWTARTTAGSSVTPRQQCGPRPSVLGQDQSETKKDRSRSCRSGVVLWNTVLLYVRRPVVLWSMGAHLRKPGWSKPHTHSNPTNLALFGHKITVYGFNRGSYYCRGAQIGAGGWAPSL